MYSWSDCCAARKVGFGLCYNIICTVHNETKCYCSYNSWQNVLLNIKHHNTYKYIYISATQFLAISPPSPNNVLNPSRDILLSSVMTWCMSIITSSSLLPSTLSWIAEMLRVLWRNKWTALLESNSFCLTILKEYIGKMEKNQINSNLYYPRQKSCDGIWYEFVR